MKFITTILIAGISLLVAGCWDETTIRSDKPVSRAKALKDLGDFPFPLSAHSIHYLFYAAGMQELEEYVRYDVAPKDLDSATNALVAWTNKQSGFMLSYPREPLASSPATIPRADFLPMTWWNPSAIPKGYYRGYIKSHALEITVDEVNSRIYVHQTD